MRRVGGRRIAGGGTVERGRDAGRQHGNDHGVGGRSVGLIRSGENHLLHEED